MPSKASVGAAGGTKHKQDVSKLKADLKKLDQQINATFELHGQRQKPLHEEHRKLDQQLTQQEHKP